MIRSGNAYEQQKIIWSFILKYISVGFVLRLIYL